MRRLALLVIAGCGRLGFEPGTLTPDANDGDVLDPSCFVEPFDNLDTARWRTSFPPNAVTVAVANGRLELTPAPLVNEYNGLSNRNRIDLTDAAIEVELVQTTNQSNTETSLEIELTQASRYIIAATDGRLKFIERGAGNEVDRVLDTTAHRFWRMRHDAAAARVTLQTSSDRTQWSSGASFGAPATAASYVYLYAGQFGAGNPSPGTGMFDNVRVVTPNCP